MDESRKIYLNAKGVEAKGYLKKNYRVIIYAGSEVHHDLTKSKLTQTLINDGIIGKKIEENKFLFLEDYEASSPSCAAQIILGMQSCRGPFYWKNSKNISIGVAFPKNKRIKFWF